MSDLPQRADPDLHAIFGIDGDRAAGVDRVISVERGARSDPDVEAAAAPHADVRIDVDPEAISGADVELDPLPSADVDFETIVGADPYIEVEPAIEGEPGLDQRQPSDAADPGADASAPESASQRVAQDPELAGVTKPSQRGSSQRFLTDVIVDMGLASRKQVDDALESSRVSGTTPERVLLDSGALTQDGLARALAERYGLDHLDLGVFSVDMGAANLVSTAVAKRYQTVPVAFTDKRTLLVAMADPSNVLAVDDIAIMTGYEIRVAVAPPDDIAALISRLDRLEDVVGESEESVEDAEDGAEVVALHETSEDAPVIKLVNQIVAQAVERGASDVHLAPDGRELRVRFRVDGVLADITTVPRRMAAGVISRIKIMAELNIAEKRLPQDGRVGPGGRRPPCRPARRDAAQRPRRGRRDARPRQGVRGRGARQARHGRARARALRTRLRRDTRRGARHRSHRLGQVHDAVRGAADAQHAREEHHHGRGPSRVRNGRPHPGAGLGEGGTHVRGGPAHDGARRPRRDHGRRDPRPRDRPDRRGVRADRASGALHAAHQRRAVGDHQVDRDGDRAVPGRLGARVHRRPAPGADAVPELQAAHDHPREGAARERLQGARGARGLRAGGLSSLRRQRLPRTRRSVRGDEDVSGDPGDGARTPARPRRSATWPSRRG